MSEEEIIGYISSELKEARVIPAKHERLVRLLLSCCLAMLVAISGIVLYMGNLFISEQREQGRKLQMDNQALSEKLATQNGIQLVLQEKVSQWVGHVQALNANLTPLYAMRTDIDGLARRIENAEENIDKNYEMIKELKRFHSPAP